MNIQYTNIGEPYQKFSLYLTEGDYATLFKQELGFGKLLNIFVALGEMIAEDPKLLREWAVNDSRFNGVELISKKIIEILDEYDSKDG